MTAAPAQAYELDPDGKFAERVVAITEDVPAPETVIDMANGARTSIDAHLGKVVIVTMWATWCHVCEVEMPVLAEMVTRYEGRDLAILPVSVDQPPAEEIVARHLEEHDLAIFPVMLDRNFALAGRIGLRGTPTSLIVDKFGQVVAAFEGQAPWTDPDTEAYLDALMAVDDPAASRALLGAL